MKKTVEASAKRPAKALSSEVATGSRSHRNANGPRAADRIRASASELFYREGIRAVGVDEVVERAGVTKPSLYRSFASKDDLAAAYMRDYDLDFWEKFENPGGKSYSDPREHVLAYIRVLSTRAVRETCTLTCARSSARSPTRSSRSTSTRGSSRATRACSSRTTRPGRRGRSLRSASVCGAG